MLTVSQLAIVLYVVYTVWMIFKLVFIELNDNTSPTIQQRVKRLSESNFVVYILLLSYNVISPAIWEPEAFPGKVIVLLMSIALIVFSSSLLWNEMVGFYSKYTFTRKKLLVVSGIQMAVEGLFIYLILR